MQKSKPKTRAFSIDDTLFSEIKKTAAKFGLSPSYLVSDIPKNALPQIMP